MAEANETSPAKTKELLGTLPLRSQDRHDWDANFDVSVWRCTGQGWCEWSERSPCDTLIGIYYGSAEDEVTKFCPRHFYEMHYGPDAPYRLVDRGERCKTCGSEIDPWGFGIPLEQALDHKLAEVRGRAKLKQQFDRYCSLRLEQKIRLAMDILHDVDDTWDHDNLESYPDDMPSFDEFLSDLGDKLYEIAWK